MAAAISSGSTAIRSHRDQPELRDSILRVYQELDRQAAELLALVPAETTVLMMSDHGFGGVSDWVIYPNCWLHQQRFLHFRGQGRHRGSRALNALKLWAVAHLPAWVQRTLYRCAGPLLGRIEARVRYGMIDWTGTEAYFDENPYFPVLRINLKGRQPHGIVEPGKHYEEVRDRLIGELEAWRHPKTGARIVEKAYRREEVYSGPCLEQAADVIPKWALHQGYSYAFKMSSRSPGMVWIEQVDPQRPENQQFFTSKSGTHRDDGIFLAQGPGIQAGRTVEEARIIDLAPTILHLLDVPVPADMDGCVLEEILTEVGAEEAAAWAFPAGPHRTEGDWCPPTEDKEVYSAEDEARIAARLAQLGYVEE
jgi:predicted AlkP superfamily phosphohydrolase/phosphomutase